MEPTLAQTAKKALKATAPILAGYLALGFGFGVLMYAHGYPAWLAVLMSCVIYAGSGQYVAVELLSGGATLLICALTTLCVNARHLFYGVSMLEKFHGAGWRKPYMIFALTDETYALLCSTQTQDRTYCFLVCLFDHLYWIAGGALGALLGPVLPFPTEGIDFTLTALFVTIFLEQWLTSDRYLPALIGVGVTALCLVLFGSERFLLPAMAIILALILLLQRREAKKDG